MEAHPPLSSKDVLPCQSALSPPVYPSVNPEFMAEPAGAEAATAHQHSQSDARKSAERLRREGGDQ